MCFWCAQCVSDVFWMCFAPDGGFLSAKVCLSPCEKTAAGCVRKKTLDLGRIGARNGPDGGFFGQSLPKALPKLRSLMRKDCCRMIAPKNHRSGPYRRPKRPRWRVFRPEPAQGLAQASFLYQERLLHDDCAKKPSIWAVSAPETAQIEGFSGRACAEPCPSFVPL